MRELLSLAFKKTTKTASSFYGTISHRLRVCLLLAIHQDAPKKEL